MSQHHYEPPVPEPADPVYYDAEDTELKVGDIVHIDLPDNQVVIDMPGVHGFVPLRTAEITGFDGDEDGIYMDLLWSDGERQSVRGHFSGSWYEPVFNYDDYTKLTR